MKNSIILFTILFITSSILANEFHGYSQKVQYTQEEDKNYQNYKNSNKKDGVSHIGDISRFVIGTVYSLDLTKKQEHKINKIIKKFKNTRFNQFNGFTKDGFDKQKFINARKNTKEDTIKLKADLIEKIYHTLNKEQIIEMNKEITLFKKKQEIEIYIKMKEEKRYNDQYSNDRR